MLVSNSSAPRRLSRLAAISVVLVCVVAVSAHAAIDARMFRYADVSATQVAFVYAGDIWVVGKAGGLAVRLSSPAGEEAFPRFSPDGSRIAFSANYDGNGDVYVIPTSGGTPHRVTYHPGDDRLLDWTPDGTSLLFASNRTHGLNVRQFFRVPAQGGMPEKLPVPYGEFGALADDGRRIAYTTKAREFRTWKRYRGGLAPEIWLFDLQTSDARNLSHSDANDVQPMWHGDTLYFLSDRGAHERYNIWALDAESDTPRQVTRFTDVDITFPAIGPSEIVFQAGGRLHLLNLSDETHAEMKIEVVTDQAPLRPRRLNVGERIENAGISPSGARAVFEARGELFTLPAKHGFVRQLSHTSGVAERYPSWSPDGRHIAYWSDRTGEYQLALIDAKGEGDERVLTDFGPGFRYALYWSPDSAKIAFIDNTQAIQILDVETKQVTVVDHGLQWSHPDLTGFEVDWSGDSRFMAYHRHLDNGLTAVFLYDTVKSSLHQVTSGYYGDSGPAFGPDGKYLYYQSSRDLAPLYSDLDGTWIYPNTTRLMAVPLRNDVASPLAPRNDVEADDDADDDADDASDDGNDKKKKKGKKDDDSENSGKKDHKDGLTQEKKELTPEPVEIDLDGFEARAVLLPPEAGNYGALRAVSGKLLYQRFPRRGTAGGVASLAFYDLEEREEKEILGSVDGFEVSADGKKLIVAQEGAWAIVDLSPDAKIEDRLPTGELASVVNPAEEWAQMFNDIWRTYRDNFYDPGMHGLDWEAVGNQYRELLADAVTRWDANFVMGQLIGEINASHTYVGGGDLEQPLRRPVGLLGIDWKLDGDVYRIARIVRGAPWDVESRSPLAEPGLEVQEGDAILAVNGVPIDTSREPWAALAGSAGKTVMLTVNSKPTFEGAHEILVDTLRSDRRLRQLDWIETNRRHVAEATDGRIGYAYVPDTTEFGQTELVRQYTSQAAKDGLIVDERWNGGGQLPDRFVELMNRRRVTYIYPRFGKTVGWPAGALNGPKVMLINGWAGSGGDAFPLFFREMGAGPLIGERTWGGLIGPAFGHSLIDGGFYTAPPGRLYTPAGKWFAEGHGVDPDIPVVDDPAQLARGRDPQLEAAIAEVMRLVETGAPRWTDPPEMESRVPASGGN